MRATDSKLSRNARAVLGLFTEKPEWTSAEISFRLDMNIETVKKILKQLTDCNHISKQGTTKGAWYEKAN
jgi:transcription initiation factor IIE alpha subunit